MPGALTKNNISRMSGFSLLEVLVAVVVLSVGLLGLAGLHARILKTNASSMQRSQIVMLSYYIIDAMRADKTRAVAGAYDMQRTCTLPSAGVLSDNNKRSWMQALKDSLGNTNNTCGQISCDNAGNCTVTVWWDDSRGSGSTVQSMETRTRL